MRGIADTAEIYVKLEGRTGVRKFPSLMLTVIVSQGSRSAVYVLSGGKVKQDPAVYLKAALVGRVQQRSNC